MLYPFGHGLSYVPFTFDNVRVAVSPSRGSAAGAAIFRPNDVVTVSVDVSNGGKREASTPVLLFVTNNFSMLAPERKMVKASQRVTIKSSKIVTVRFQVRKDWAPGGRIACHALLSPRALLTPPASQLVNDNFAYDTNTDILDQHGRMMKSSAFTFDVEGSQAQVLLQGDAENTNSWTRLRTYVA